MRLTSIPVCLAQGHIWGESHQVPGFDTCRRCRLRRRRPNFVAPDAAPAETSRLRTITVAARKGGSGKSTIALHLAIAAHLRDHTVLVADTDGQRSSTESLGARKADRIECLPTMGGALEALKGRVRAAGLEYLIIDTPGGPGPDLAQAMTISDLNVLVARPSFLDIAAAARTFREARALDAPALIVLNQAPPARGGEEAAATVKALEALRYTRLPVSPVILHARAAFQSAVALGRSVEELGRSPAADEAAALWGQVESMFADERPGAEAVSLAAGVASTRPSEPGALSP